MGEADAAAGTGLAVGRPTSRAASRPRGSRSSATTATCGYRDVRGGVAADGERGDGGGVDVAFTVHEGPRYVVQAVRTSGVESTRDGARRPGDAARPG